MVSPDCVEDAGGKRDAKASDRPLWAACTSATCCSSFLLPRTDDPMSAPMATSDTATIASATSVSIRVNPAIALSGETSVRDNLDPSSQPVDANLVARIEMRERNDTATGHARPEEADGLESGPVVAIPRQQRLEPHVIGEADGLSIPTRTDRTRRRINSRRDLESPADRGIAICLQERGDLDGIGFETRPRCLPGDGGQQHRCEQCDDRERADHLQQGEAGLASVATTH